MKIGVFSVLAVVLCLGMASAGFFEDVFGGMTGRVVDGEITSIVDNAGVECDKAKFIFEEQYSGYSIPEAIPFSDDVFNIYVDDSFFISIELVEKKMTSVSCEALDASYDVYVSSGLIAEVLESGSDLDFVDFYNEKRNSGDLRIEAVGFGKKFKLGMINFGLKIASWFN